MITLKGLNMMFCCEPMLHKVLEGHIQMVPTGGNFFRVFSGWQGGWETHAEQCPSMKFCPYCGKKINKSRDPEEE